MRTCIEAKGKAITAHPLGLVVKRGEKKAALGN
jgi:hypothetical protein